MVFGRVARLAIAAPRRVVACAAALLVCAAIFGVGVTSRLSAGGFEDPHAESSQAAELLTAKFRRGDLQMLFTVTAAKGVDSAEAITVGKNLVATLSASPFVSDVTSTWTAPPAAAPALTSVDRRTGLVVVGIRGGGSDGQQHAKDLAEHLVGDRDGVAVRAGGAAMAYVEINQMSRRDLMIVEAIAIPLSFLVLVWVFGGLAAAALPVAVGVLAIAGTTAVLRAMTYVTNVSTFALNLSVALGLALAVDYTLLIVSRFRDEVRGRAELQAALMTTMTTAGRTVAFSACTVALSMLSLLVFPMYFLRSFAYAGAAVAAFAALAAIVVTPAALVLLGKRLDALDMHRALRRLTGRSDPAPAPLQTSFWYRSTKRVVRRPALTASAVIALLLVLGSPFLGVRLGFPDDRVLPTSASTRQVGDELRTGFGVDPAGDVTIVVPDATELTLDDFAKYAAQVSRTTPDVYAVSSPAGTFVNGAAVGPPSAPTGIKDGSAYLTVRSTAILFSTSDEQLDLLGDVPGPGGRPVLFTGIAPINRDTATSISSRLPQALAIVAVITFTLLFLLTGSAVLPIKALVLNTLSLTAAFGALVWIFQEGHLGGLGTTVTGTLVVTIPILLFCVAFGLSMDYEVFLISRIREYWLASPRRPEDNSESVALGLARTGRVVTAAALVMAVSFVALIAADVSVIRMLGVGITLAVVMDATLVRMLAVPAFMQLLGSNNWWAPEPLARLHRRLTRGHGPG
jgi:RND superfamily putative drug exporter